MKLKPKTEIVPENNYMRFDPLYKCYCPQCNRILKRSENICTCGQEIDWSEWRWLIINESKSEERYNMKYYDKVGKELSKNDYVEVITDYGSQKGYINLFQNGVVRVNCLIGEIRVSSNKILLL